MGGKQVKCREVDAKEGYVLSDVSHAESLPPDSGACRLGVCVCVCVCVFVVCVFGCVYVFSGVLVIHSI